MKLLEERIVKDGKILPGNVLKVDSFLNHQIDVNLIDDCAEEWYRLFKDEKINKINIDACLMEFRQTIARRNDGAMGNFDEKNLWTEAKIIYSLLQNIKYN